MRRISLAALVVVAVAAAAYGLIEHFPYMRAESKAGRRVIYYVDPMHPAYKSDKPGIAPDCGMQLVPVYADGSGSASHAPAVAHSAPGVVTIDSNSQRLLGIRTVAVQKGGAARMTHVVGRVLPEDTRTYKVNSGVDGLIKQTFNDSVGTIVKKDQKLADFYAPDFLAAASGFLAASERMPGAVGKDGARFSPEFPGTIAKRERGVSRVTPTICATWG